jgi:hypothetical protein
MRKIRLLLAIVPILVICIFLPKCGNSPNNTNSTNVPASSTPGIIDLQGTNEKDIPIIILNDGRRLVGQEQITKEFQILLQDNPDATYNLNIAGEELPTVTINGEDMVVSPIYVKLPYNYGVVFSYHTGMVSKCNRNRTIPHFNFIINKQGVKTPIVDLHVGGWKENNQLCLCIYISPQDIVVFKKCFSPPKLPPQIATPIATALIYAGLSTATAYAIANVLAPIVAAGLTL